jgi:hypothetical protein
LVKTIIFQSLEHLTVPPGLAHEKSLICCEGARILPVVQERGCPQPQQYGPQGGSWRFGSASLQHQGFLGSIRFCARPLNYLRAIRSHRNCACSFNGGCCIVPWKGTGRRQPRMRYSGTVVLWAQSSLAAPFFLHRLTGTSSQRVIQMPTKISSFSRLSNRGGEGVRLR